jgi:hypothetical protein
MHDSGGEFVAAGDTHGACETLEEDTIPNGDNNSRVTRGWVVGKMIEPFRCEFCNVGIVNRFPFGFLDANDGAV